MYIIIVTNRANNQSHLWRSVTNQTIMSEMMLLFILLQGIICLWIWSETKNN